jgi:NADH-quinone oxidoreductase subunit A
VLHASSVLAGVTVTACTPCVRSKRRARSTMVNQYVPVIVTFAIAATVIGALTGVSALLGPRRAGAVKGETFECGNPPSGAVLGRRVSVRFYLIAILFIVFDVEVVFMYPWALLARQLGVFGLVEMLVFVLVLSLGLVYAWRRGALEWN